MVITQLLGLLREGKRYLRQCNKYHARGKKKTILKALLLHASDLQSSPGTWRGRRIIFWCLSDKAGTMQQGWDSHSPEVTVPLLCGC